MDEVSRAYFEMYGYTVTNEMFSHNGEVKYQIVKESVDTEAVKERIAKGSKEAANPKHSRKDVDALHNKRREEVKELTKEEYRSNISYARASVNGSRKRAKEQPGSHKGDDTKYQHDLNKKAFKNLVNQERAKRSLNKEETEVIVSHLLDRGFADTEKSAENIMEAMSDQWVESILSEAPFDVYRGNTSVEGTKVGSSQPTKVNKSSYATRKAANRKADKLNMDYGANIHSVVRTPEN